MRHDPLPPFQTEASLPGLSFAVMDTLIGAQAAEDGLDLHNGHGRSTWCKLPDGAEFGAKVGPTGSILFARAHTRDRLQDVVESVTHHSGNTCPACSPPGHPWTSRGRIRPISAWRAWRA